MSDAVQNENLRVLIVNAIATDKYNAQRVKFLSTVTNPNTVIGMVSIEHGFESLEYLNEELINVVDTVKKVGEGERNGFDSAMINCFFDPGLYEARELVKMPVVGAGEAAMFLASRMGHKFAVMATSAKSIPIIERNVERYHLERNLSGVLSLGIGVPRLQHEGLSDEIRGILVKQIDKAVAGGAESITVGCTAALGIGKLLSQISPVPVVDPAVAGLKAAEMMGSLYKLTGLSHSKICSYAYTE